MYGHIHVILKDFVLSTAGAAAWAKVLVEAALEAPGDEARVLAGVAQGDEVTLALIGAIVGVLGLDPGSFLRAFGLHFADFALRSGNATFLRSQGANLHTFLANVNTMHNFLERDLADAQFPFLEALYDPVRDAVHLTYLSTREGLKGLLMGVVEGIGKRLYGLSVSFQDADIAEELRGAAEAGRAAAWLVTWRPCPEEAASPRGAPPPPGQRPGLPRMSFPALHSATTDFARLLRRASAALAPCACKQRKAEAEWEQAEWEQAEREAEVDVPPPLMTRGDSVRKSIEVKIDVPRRPLDHVLMRAISARHVAAAWSDPTLPLCGSFWESSSGRSPDYDLSVDAARVDGFVSHSWSPPGNWAAVMGSDMTYADAKSTTLAVMAKDLALMKKEELRHWGDVTFWVDKACIPQDDLELKQLCINLIGKFISHCDHVCIIFTWSYLERLWCVFEWACILADKDLRRVWLMNELFVTERTLPLYIDCIRSFSLKRTKCYLMSDMAILAKQITDNYVSHGAFEELVKASAIALMARSMAFRAGRSGTWRDRFFTPWVRLARDLGFRELAGALGGCRALEWRVEAVPALEPGQAPHQMPVPRRVSSAQYHQRINEWFDECVSPSLYEMRLSAVLH